MGMLIGNVTASRAEAMRKLIVFGQVRVGMGMWDPSLAVVSPAAADWLVGNGLAARVDGVKPYEIVPTARLDAELDGCI